MGGHFVSARAVVSGLGSESALRTCRHRSAFCRWTSIPPSTTKRLTSSSFVGVPALAPRWLLRCHYPFARHGMVLQGAPTPHFMNLVTMVTSLIAITFHEAAMPDYPLPIQVD